VDVTDGGHAGLEERRGTSVGFAHHADRPRNAKALRWNSPLYGMQGQGWFLNFHCYTKYVKVGFFDGASLDPPSPGESRGENVRCMNVYEDGELDEAQFAP
jgi:hypothetical protein